jgi:type IV secretion system protein VirB9
MEGRELVIHRLARHFILRRGKLLGCITNKGFTGSGERLESGTVSPQVHRETKEIGP